MLDLAGALTTSEIVGATGAAGGDASGTSAPGGRRERAQAVVCERDVRDMLLYMDMYCGAKEKLQLKVCSVHVVCGAPVACRCLRSMLELYAVRCTTGTAAQGPRATARLGCIPRRA